MADLIPPNIDYTSRDFPSIVADMQAYARIAMPEWNTGDTNDFGVVLMELFAGMGDMLNYYVDRVASEAYLESAVLRRNILSLSRTLGYNPTPQRSATTTLQLNNSFGAPIVVPAGSRFYAQSVVNGLPYNIYFETDSDVTIPGGNPGGATVTATQGITIPQEDVGQSDGTTGQTFVLFNPNVAAGSCLVEVNETGLWAPWRNVDHVIDYGPKDPVCEVFEDENGLTYVRFGDNVSGRVPTIGSDIRVTYRICDGALGNVASGAITNPVTPITGLSGVANGDAAVGGADRESNQSIRFNAPRALRALSRGVTVNDYAYLALQVTGVAKASAALTAPGAVTVYVAGTSASPPGATLKNAVTAFLSDKTMVGTTVTVGDPVYAPIDITVTVFVQPQFRQDFVRTSAVLAVKNALSFDNVTFGDTIVPADILKAITAIDGVQTATVQVLDRAGYNGIGGVALSPNEIPTLGTLGISMQNGIV